MLNHVPVSKPAHVRDDQLFSFNMFRPHIEGRNYFSIYKAFRDADVGELVWTPYHDGHWIATRYDVIKEVFEDHERFSSNRINVSAAPGAESSWIPTSLDPPQHRSIRNLLNPVFAPRHVAALEPKIRALAQELIGTFRDRGRCEFMGEFADSLPTNLFIAMADLPMADARKLQLLSQQMTRPGAKPRSAVQQEFFDYLRPIIAERRYGAGKDVISILVNGRPEGRELTEDEALKLTGQVLQAGMDTIASFLGLVILTLADKPDIRREIVADPNRIHPFIDELFRTHSVVTIGREVRYDMTYRGAELKRGEIIMCPTALAGFDDRVNVDPFDFDLDRSGRVHSAFGNGPHRCAGAALGRLEVLVAIEEWLKQIPEFSVPPDADIRFVSGVTPAIEHLPVIWEI